MATSGTVALPFRVTPLNNIQPFTYRDSTGHMAMLEKLRVYVNSLTGEFNDGFDELVTALNAGLAQQDIEIATYFDGLVASVNNRVGPVSIQRITLTGDVVLDFEPEWPDAHPVWFQVKQGGAGEHSLTLGAGISGELDLYTLAGMVTEFALIPDGGGLWHVHQPDSTLRRNDLYVNVRDFGARPNGDDVTAQVQAAADAAQGRILFYGEPGDYIQKGAVILGSNTTVEMVPGAWVRKTTGSTTYVAFLALAGLTPGYGATKNIAFRNCNFRGDLGKGVSVNALSAHRLSGLVVEGCKFWETSQNGHVFDLQGCENILIESSEFRGIKKVTGRGYVEAIQLDSSVSTGTGFAETLVAGEFFDGTPTRNVVVRNNVFGPIRVDGVTYPAQSPLGSHGYVDGRPYTNITFTGNTIENVVANDGGYPGILHFVATQDVKITNNKVYSDGTNANTFVRFFRGGNAIPFTDVANPNAVTAPPTIKINPKNVTVEGNEITGLSTTGNIVWVYGEDGWLVPNLLVSNNRFVECQTSTDSGALVQATWTVNAQVLNNRAHDCGHEMVVVGDSIDPTVAGNVGNGGEGSPVNVYDCATPLVSHNRFRNYTSWLNIEGSSNVAVKNNDVTATVNGAAVKVIAPPTPPGYIHLIGNTVGNTSAAVVTSDSGVGISTGYLKGLVSGNLSQNYAVPVDVNPGPTYANNVAV